MPNKTSVMLSCRADGMLIVGTQLLNSIQGFSKSMHMMLMHAARSIYMLFVKGVCRV